MNTDLAADDSDTDLPGGWNVGDLVDVEGKAGWELRATILGRPEGKDEKELRGDFIRQDKMMDLFSQTDGLL